MTDYADRLGRDTAPNELVAFEALVPVVDGRRVPHQPVPDKLGAYVEGA